MTNQLPNRDSLLLGLKEKLERKRNNVVVIRDKDSKQLKYIKSSKQKKQSRHLKSKTESPIEGTDGEIEQSLKKASSFSSYKDSPPELPIDVPNLSTPSVGVISVPAPASAEYGSSMHCGKLPADFIPTGITSDQPPSLPIDPSKALPAKNREPKTLPSVNKQSLSTQKDQMTPPQKAFFCYCAHIARGDPKFSYFYEEHGIQMSWKDIELYVKDHPEEFNLKDLEKAKSKAFGHWFRNGADLVESGGKRHAQAVVGVWHEIMENLFRDEYGWGREKPQELIVRTAADEILDQMRSKRIQKSMEIEIE
jgi:hypothetical protein